MQTSNPLLPFLPLCKLVNDDCIEAWIETCVLRMMSDITWHTSQPVWVKDEKWGTTEDTWPGNKTASDQNGRSGEGAKQSEHLDANDYSVSRNITRRDVANPRKLNILMTSVVIVAGPRSLASSPKYLFFVSSSYLSPDFPERPSLPPVHTSPILG